MSEKENSKNALKKVIWYEFYLGYRNNNKIWK